MVFFLFKKLSSYGKIPAVVQKTRIVFHSLQKEWLEKYNFPYDEIHCVKYGTTKANCTRNKADFQILFDDCEKIRNGWTLGETVNAELDIMTFLKALL